MKTIIIITSLEQLKEGMKVSFKHYCLAKYRDAVVTDMKYKEKYRMLDGKPVRAITVESVNLTCENGKKITVRESNFRNFYIFSQKNDNKK